MAAGTPDDRMAYVEQVLRAVAEDHQQFSEDLVSLRQIVADLATSTRRGFDQLAEQQRLTTEQMQETDRRFRQTDERIGKLVVAIGLFMQQSRN